VAVQQNAALFTALAAGANETCGLTSAGQAYCWGRNSSGEVGMGTINAARLTPAAVAQPGGVVFASLSVGGAHVCGVTTGHVAYCWGNNIRGQLGDGTQTTRTSPFQVAPFAGSTLLFGVVAAGAEHTCGVTTGGVVYCWGDNDAGQLGDAVAEVFGAGPVPVSTPAGIVYASVAAGLDRTCALSTAGQAFCWGDNNFGQLGDGTYANVRTTPIASAPGIAFSSIIAGGVHTCGLSPSGSLVFGYCWGDGSSGQAGNGRFEFSPLVAPVFIAATH
jgi:alpha-tubulin suppressor-like RCC1 family protein